VALFGSTLIWLGYQWRTDEYYAHGPVVLLVSAFFFWRATRRWGESRSGARSFAVGTACVAAGVAAHVLATDLRAPYLSVGALIVILCGLVLALRGGSALRQAAFPLGFLAAAAPLPFVAPLSQPLQIVTARWAAGLAFAAGLPVSQTGAQLSVTGCSLVVGAPCSGLRSIVTFLSLLALLLYITQGVRAAKVALALLAVPVALASNVLRVTSLLAVAQVWGAEAALHYYHTAFGFVFYLLALALLLTLAGVLGCRDIRSDI
jgi:exosortase